MMSTMKPPPASKGFVSFPTSGVPIDGGKRHRGVVLGILASSWTGFLPGTLAYSTSKTISFKTKKNIEKKRGIDVGIGQKRHLLYNHESIVNEETCQLSPFICMSRQVTVLPSFTISQRAGCGEKYEKSHAYFTPHPHPPKETPSPVTLKLLQWKWI